MKPWQTVGTATATICGHTYPIQSAINDLGEPVIRHDAYPDPNAATFTYDAPELCKPCYTARMERKLMSFCQMKDAWQGK